MFKAIFACVIMLEMKLITGFGSICLFLIFSVYPVISSPITVLHPAETRDVIVDIALSYKGSPYRYGGMENSGFDCSGFVFRVFVDATGQRIPRTSAGLYAWAEPISSLEMQKGDLLFFNTTGTVSHVGIYMGNGRFIHSASDGPETGIIISSLEEPYWKRRYIGAGRVVPPAEFRGIFISLASMALCGPSTNPTFFYGFEELLTLSMNIPIGTRTVQPGIGVLCMWNYYTGSFNCPVVISLDLSSHFMLFAGWPIIAGLAWEPIAMDIKKGPLRGGTLSVIGMATLHEVSDPKTTGSLQGTLSAGIQIKMPL